ncbi:DNA primase [Streptomyces sp. NBC_00481]|uniref:DNA primase n=1 Tax=unclassified Streptomyces TaxID=2593676 RepID=UPI002DDC03CB|nr:MULTISPECIES: DNA primase [unclassified Streptomyces]WRY94544.1 DNA primase [Streptomyces sp. NBC_00481]
MNRIGLGLAVGAGYVLGRTRKMKLAFAVGTMVAGKRMHLSPRALADLVSQQLLNNPQFKEIGDQLRGDLRGVGKAATGALVERQIEGLADRLHGRTSQVRDQLAGAAPDLPGRGGKDRADEYADDEYADTRDEYDDEGDGGEYEDAESRGTDGEESEEEPSRKRPAKKSPPRSEGKPAARKAPAKKTAPSGSAARKSAAKKTAAKKTAAKKTAPGRAPAKKAARKATRSRTTRGGGEDD